jgi:hypothetical protein
MSNTYHKFKGKKYPQKCKKKPKDKKFFGFTDGTHSRSEELVPKKLEQFVKYGWPYETRSKKVIKYKQDLEDKQ